MFLTRLVVRLMLGLLILVIVLLVVGDFLARAEAEKLLANRVRADTGARQVSVHVGSFPFLYEVALSKISDVEVVAQGVPVGVLRLTQVTVQAHQVGIDHHALWFDQKVEVASIERANVTVLIRTTALQATLNAIGQVSVVDGHDLAVTVLGRRVLTVDLTSSQLIPDCDFGLHPTNDGYQLSCTVAPVPSSLLATLSAQAS